MPVNFPAPLRRALYIATMVLSPVVVYARAKNWIGDLELTLWSAEVVVVSGLAAFKTADPVALPDDDSPTGEVAGPASDLPTGTPTVTEPATEHPQPGYTQGV